MTFIYDTPCVGGPRNGSSIPAIFEAERDILPIYRKVIGWKRGFYKFLPRRHHSEFGESAHGDTWVWHSFLKAKK